MTRHLSRCRSRNLQTHQLWVLADIRGSQDAPLSSLTALSISRRRATPSATCFEQKLLAGRHAMVGAPYHQTVSCTSTPSELDKTFLVFQARNGRHITLKPLHWLDGAWLEATSLDVCHRRLPRLLSFTELLAPLFVTYLISRHVHRRHRRCGLQRQKHRSQSMANQCLLSAGQLLRRALRVKRCERGPIHSSGRPLEKHALQQPALLPRPRSGRFHKKLGGVNPTHGSTSPWRETFRLGKLEDTSSCCP